MRATSAIASWLFGALLCAGFAHAAPNHAPSDLTQVPGNLINLRTKSTTIHFDIRYASANNFLGRVFYDRPAAYLQRAAADALERAHARVQMSGFGLLVTDAYRPWSVTLAFWQAVTPAQRQAGFVAKPSVGSRHNRGCAVDVTLYELATGKEVTMPSDVDEMSERAAPTFTGANGESQAARDLLISAMQAEGFDVLYNEWWHFDYRDWRRYPPMDISFEQLARQSVR